MKKWYLYLLMPIILFFGTISVSETVQAKELQNVITDVKIWSSESGQEKKPGADGVYHFYLKNSYQYKLNFDLSAYNGNLADGDAFTFTIPAPIPVKAETFDLVDKETGVAIGEVNVTSDPAGGGKATISLKNLAEYLKKKNADEVRDITGDFYVSFKFTEEVSQQTITFPKTETKDEVTHTFVAEKPSTPNYGEVIGKTNFNKDGGVITKKPWTSEKLGKSGDYYHYWYVRVNQKQAAYDTIEIHDFISTDYSPMQFIPESLTVTAGWYDTDYSLKDQTVLASDQYNIVWNESYTDFVITIPNAKNIIKNGKPAAFRVNYNTTAPADGTKVGNKVEIKGDDKVLTISDDDKRTLLEVTGNSVVTSGGSITLKTGYRITLYKVDSKTQNRLAGAKFKITPPAGATAQEEIVETNADGVAQSSIYSEADVKLGEFTITEVEAPAGYELDPTPIKVTVGKDGIIKTIENKRSTTKAELTATKKLEGRELKADEFEFVLTDKDGVEVETVKNDKDGNIKFNELTFDQEGTYTYTISEKKAGTTEKGVTYDANPVKATVTVTKDPATGKLSSTVSYDNNDNVFKNCYKPALVKAELEVSKNLNGRPLKNGEFNFVLKDENGAVVETVQNDGDGKVKFSELSFKKADTYNYTIVELNDGEANITYDELEVKVKVIVTDDGEGKLIAKVDYPADTEFNNKYVEPTTTTTTTSTTTEATTTPATTVTTTEATTTPATTVTTAEATTTPATTVTTAEATTTPATTVTTAEATTTPATTVTTAEATTTPATTVTTAETTTTAAATTTAEATTTTVAPATTTAASTSTVAPTTSVTTTAATTVDVPGTTTGVTPPPAGGKKGKTLPKTGEESGLTTSLVGFALMTVAGVAGVLYRKSREG